MKMKVSAMAVALLTVLFFAGACADKAAEPFFVEAPVFVSGADGYDTFRIPAVVVTTKGTVLAFCEGRRNSRSDTGDIDIVFRRSEDGGVTWGPMQVLWDDGGNVCGNPCPTIDVNTGMIHLLLTRNLGNDPEPRIIDGTSEGTRTVHVMASDDDGMTWSEPKDITASTKKADWTWYATGPGVGIQLATGRLVVPCDHIVTGTKVFGSHVIYSDDGGKSWVIGGSVEPMANECQAVELADGRVLLNMRNYSGNHRRAVATSFDQGMTWSSVRYDETLVEPVCQAGIFRITDAELHGRSRILFSNPASEKRVAMTVRLSYDECETWPVSREINPGPSAYSSLTIMSDGTIGCLYECGEENAYETITFARFNLAWLSGGADSLL